MNSAELMREAVKQKLSGRRGRIKYQVSRITYHVSRITYHVSRITYHVSRITYHVSRITYHVSRITYHVSLLENLLHVRDQVGAVARVRQSVVRHAVRR